MWHRHSCDVEQFERRKRGRSHSCSFIQSLVWSFDSLQWFVYSSIIHDVAFTHIIAWRSIHISQKSQEVFHAIFQGIPDICMYYTHLKVLWTWHQYLQQLMLRQSSAGVRRFYFWSNNMTSYPESSFPLTSSKNFSVIWSMEFHNLPSRKKSQTIISLGLLP